MRHKRRGRPGVSAPNRPEKSPTAADPSFDPRHLDERTAARRARLVALWAARPDQQPADELLALLGAIERDRPGAELDDLMPLLIDARDLAIVYADPACAPFVAAIQGQPRHSPDRCFADLVAAMQRLERSA